MAMEQGRVTATVFHDFITQLQDKVHDLLSKIEAAVPALAPVIDKVEQFFDHIVSRLDGIASPSAAPAALSSDSIVSAALPDHPAEAEPLTARFDDGWPHHGFDPWRSSDFHLPQSVHDHWLV